MNDTSTNTNTRDKKVPLVEMFGPTIQGEGTVIGQQTYFLRFGLCDYKCTMCDSMHAVNPAMVKKNAEWLTQDEIFDKFEEFHASNLNTTKWVTFSGGNPAIHDLSRLTERLKQAGFRINVETQGTKFAPWLTRVDSLTISPKGPGMGETHNDEVFQSFLGQLVAHADYVEDDRSMYLPDLCFKIVVFDQRDLDFASSVFHWLMYGSPIKDGMTEPSNYLYLSLGNPNPPPIDGTTAAFDIQEALRRYKYLAEEIMVDPVLSKVRFLPQWHAFVWGNENGH